MTSPRPYGVRLRLQLELHDADGNTLTATGRLVDIPATRLALIEPGGMRVGIEADEIRVAQHAHRAAREAYAEMLTAMTAKDRGF